MFSLGVFLCSVGWHCRHGWVSINLLWSWRRRSFFTLLEILSDAQTTGLLKLLYAKPTSSIICVTRRMVTKWWQISRVMQALTCKKRNILNWLANFMLYNFCRTTLYTSPLRGSSFYPPSYFGWHENFYKPSPFLLVVNLVDDGKKQRAATSAFIYHVKLAGCKIEICKG